MRAETLEARRPHVGTWLVAESFRRAPIYAGGALCLAALVPATVVAMSMDERTLHEVNLWLKPLRFEAALATYLATLAWFVGWLPHDIARARWHRVFSASAVLAAAAEMTWIGGAAAFGVVSHFNESTPVMSMIYKVMGGLAVLLTLPALLYGVVILRHQASGLNPTFRLSVAIGLLLTFFLTVGVAGYMANGPSHLHGGDGSDAEGAPVMGWARDSGDLRVAHFFATHSMHFVPAFGFIAGTLLPPNAGRMAVVAFSAFFAALVGYAFTEALMGRPFLPVLL